MPRTTRGLLVAAAVLLALSGCAAPASEPSATPAPLATATVTRGDLATETRVTGAVQYAETEPVVAGIGGVVTQLPAPGDVVAATGGTLYAIDTRPVLLLPGTVPAWRDFASGMSAGPDVAQLEQGLLALGHFPLQPDQTFGTATARAIRALQKAQGVEQTGELARSAVVFSDRDLRIDSVATRLGAQVSAGETIAQATSPEKVVVLDLASDDRGLASLGATVAVTLPTGSSTEGVVASIGSPTAKPKDDGTGSRVVLPVRITVADQGALADLALAGVSVGFAGSLGDDVLTVPVAALVPLSETQFGVELGERDADGRPTVLPVTVGASASGRVEISGEGVAEGLAVVVPGR